MSTLEHLDRVLHLVKKMRKEMAVIRQTTHKRVGMYQVMLTNEHITGQARAIRTRYRREIQNVYDELNAERKKSGAKPLENPFDEKGVKYHVA